MKENYQKIGPRGYFGAFRNAGDNKKVTKLNELIDEYNSKINTFDTEEENNDFIKSVDNQINWILNPNQEKTFTLKEIENAINSCPKYKVFIPQKMGVDDGFEGDITTIEVDMFLFRLFGSNKNEYDKYKNHENLA